MVVNKNYMTRLEVLDNSKSPYFVRPPIDRFVLAHQTTTIKARISATPEPQVQWYKNMKPIFSGTRIKICHYEPDEYTLEIADVNMDDMALYTCIARNCNGKATASASINLVVHMQIEKYPKFLERLESTSIITGRDGQLAVRATGVPQIKVKWYKDFMPLKEDRHIKIRHYEPDRYVVNVHNALPEHSGYYTCKASNDAGLLDTSAMVYVEANSSIHKLRPYIPIPCLPRSEVEKRYQFPIIADAGRQEKNHFLHRLKHGYVCANDFRIHKW